MTAYLARRLVTKYKFDSDDASETAYLAQAAYQLNRDEGKSTGGGKLDGLLSRKAFDPVHQIVRTDLASAASGAVFGARSARVPMKGTIQSDRALVQLVAATPDLQISREKASKFNVYDVYSNWMSIFKPAAALREVKSQIK